MEGEVDGDEVGLRLGDWDGAAVGLSVTTI